MNAQATLSFEAVAGDAGMPGGTRQDQDPGGEMTVYVDGAESKFGRMVMCHCLADTVAELHDFAARLGLKREWFQPMSRPHYDLSKTRRAAAVKAGAVELGRHELVAMMKRCLPTWAAEYAAARERGLPHP